MTGTTTLGTLAVVMLVLGCESATAPFGAESSPGAALRAVTSNDPHLPFEFVVPACEEEVHGSGILHILTRATTSPAGDTITGLHINARGTGVGTASGAEYRFNDSFRVLTTQIRESPLLVSFAEVLNLIGKGGVANLQLHATFRIVINAEGSQTVLVDEVRMTCR